MNKKELLKRIMKLPKIETNNPINTMIGINVDDFMNAVDRLNKIPNYNDLLKENQELKKQLEEYQKELEKADSITQSCIFNGKEESKISFRKCLNILDKKETQQKEFIKWLEDKIYSIEPKGTGINYNCEYDSEEDYVMAMQEQSRLNTLKEILQKYKSIIGVSDENNIK